MSIYRDKKFWGIRQQILIHGDQDDVFDAVTNPDRLTIWDYPDSVEVDLRVNGRIVITSGGVARVGEILKYTPPRLYSFTIPMPYPSFERNRTFESAIQYVIENVYGIIQVKMQHSGFPNEKMALLEEKAWKGIYMPRLKKYIEESSEDANSTSDDGINDE